MDFNGAVLIDKEDIKLAVGNYEKEKEAFILAFKEAKTKYLSDNKNLRKGYIFKTPMTEKEVLRKDTGLFKSVTEVFVEQGYMDFHRVWTDKNIGYHSGYTYSNLYESLKSLCSIDSDSIYINPEQVKFVKAFSKVKSLSTFNLNDETKVIYKDGDVELITNVPPKQRLKGIVLNSKDIQDILEFIKNQEK